MSNIPEIKGRLDRLAKLGNAMKEQLMRLKGPEGEGLRKRAKGQGAKLGIGAGVSVFGALLAGIALIYSLAVVILLVNIGLNRLWLSALIVVGAFLLIGAGAIGGGAALVRSSARDLSKTGDDAMKQVKETGEQMKAEADGLQELLKKEAEQRQKEAAELLEMAKAAAPVAAPAAALGLLVLRFVFRRMKSRRERRSIIRVIEAYEEVRSRE